MTVVQGLYASDPLQVTEAILRLFPKRPAGGPFALSEPGKLEALIGSAATVHLESVHECEHESEYPSLEAAVRGMMSAGGSRRAVEIFGDEAVRASVHNALAPFERTDGTVRMKNHYRCAVALAV